MYRKILVALDTTASDQELLPHIILLASMMKSEVLLLHVADGWVARNFDQLNLAEIETQIAEFGARAREGKLALEEMQCGTFTISNGGVYGSLLSTPILNAPQSGILGMHRTEERAVVRDGQIVARPMMYLALSYDHRLVDGKEAVTFLVRIKEAIEDPKRLVLDL